MTVAERYLAMAITEREAPYLEVVRKEPRALALVLREEVGSARVVQGMVGWLTIKASGLRDETGSPTRANYRRILGELTDRLAPPPRGGKPYTPAQLEKRLLKEVAARARKLDDRGDVALVVLVLGAAMAAIGAVLQSPNAVGWLQPLVVDITRSDSDGDSEAVAPPECAGGARVIELRCAPTAQRKAA